MCFHLRQTAHLWYMFCARHWLEWLVLDDKVATMDVVILAIESFQVSVARVHDRILTHRVFLICEHFRVEILLAISLAVSLLLHRRYVVLECNLLCAACLKQLWLSQVLSVRSNEVKSASRIRIWSITALELPLDEFVLALIIRAAKWLGARVLEFLAVIRLTRANLVNHLQRTLKHLHAVLDRNLARLLRVDRRRVTPMHISIKIPSLSVIWQEAAQLTID